MKTKMFLVAALAAFTLGITSCGNKKAANTDAADSNCAVKCEQMCDSAKSCSADSAKCAHKADCSKTECAHKADCSKTECAHKADCSKTECAHKADCAHKEGCEKKGDCKKACDNK